MRLHRRLHVCRWGDQDACVVRAVGAGQAIEDTHLLDMTRGREGSAQ